MAASGAPSLADNADDYDTLEFHRQLSTLKHWFHRAGLSNRRRFMVGLTHRLGEADMLNYLVHVLNRVLAKDYTYTRSRTNPSLHTDNPTECSDHALSQKYVDEKIQECLDWFGQAPSTSRSTFLFSLLGQCDIQLLHTVAHAARSAVATEIAVKTLKESSVPSTPARQSPTVPRRTPPRFPSPPRLSSPPRSPPPRQTPSMVYTDPLGYSTRLTPDSGRETTIRVKSAPVQHGESARSRSPIRSRTPNENQNQRPNSSLEFRLESPNALEISGHHHERVKSAISDRTRLTTASSERVTYASTGERIRCANSERVKSASSERGKSASSERVKSASSERAKSPKSGTTNGGILLRPKSSVTRTASRMNTTYPSSVYSQIPDDDFSEIGSVSGETVTKPEELMVLALSVDFIRDLPIHLAKYILSFLDAKSVKCAEGVSKFWRLVTRQVKKERDVQQQVLDDCLLMQGGAAEGINPAYANDIDVPVPTLDLATLVPMPYDELSLKPQNSTPFFYEGYKGFQTRNVIMEERNVFCGTYNVMIVIDKDDDSRVVHTDGECLAVATADRKIRLHDQTTGATLGPVINGHAGTIRCLKVDTVRGCVLSGSYDTTIRHWSLSTGECLRIYQGHQGTITCLRVWKNMMATASRDKTCKVWDLDTGEMVRTLKHNSAVTAVSIGETWTITGDDAGTVKVWANADGKLLKVLKGHTSTVTGITYDQWHIVTGSKDTYALVWSTQGKHKKCLQQLRHQKSVLCVEFLYLRAVTGSEDGRIRIWNALTGHCIRIMRGNSRSDPVQSLVVIGNIITINTKSNVIRLNFEEVDWQYPVSLSDRHDGEVRKTPAMFTYGQYADLPVKQRAHSYVRAKRIKISGTPSNLIPAQKDSRRVKSACTIGLQKSTRKVQQKTVFTKGRVKSAHAHFADDGAADVASVSKMTVQNLDSDRPERPVPRPDSDSSVCEEPQTRRMSWGFDRVPTPPEESKDLKQTKSLWRQQIRNPCPLQLNESSPGTQNRKFERPSSGPSKIDPRVRMPMSQITAELGIRPPKIQSERSEKSIPISPKPPPSESLSFLTKIECSKTKLAPKSTAIYVPLRPKTAAPNLSCRLNLGTVHSPFRDPLRLKQAFQLKTFEQETS